MGLSGIQREVQRMAIDKDIVISIMYYNLFFVIFLVVFWGFWVTIGWMVSQIW
jgi:hypothetical protein